MQKLGVQRAFAVLEGILATRRYVTLDTPVSPLFSERKSRRAQWRWSYTALEREPSTHHFHRACTEAGSQLGRARQFQQCAGKCLRRSRWHQQAVDAVPQRIQQCRRNVWRRSPCPGGRPPAGRWACLPDRRRPRPCWPARIHLRARRPRTHRPAAAVPSRRATFSDTQTPRHDFSPSAPARGPPPICSKRQWRPLGQLRQRRRASRRSPSFQTLPADRQDDHRIGRVGSVAARTTGRRRRKIERDPSHDRRAAPATVPLTNCLSRASSAKLRACDQPVGVGELGLRSSHSRLVQISSPWPEPLHGRPRMIAA